MKKTFKLENLDCANCAAKMEEKVAKIDGVNSVSINFFAQKMVIDADDARFEEILSDAGKALASVDSDCKILR